MRIICNLFQNNANFIPKVFGGIDTENILATISANVTYTSTQDCWVVGQIGGNDYAYLNDIQIAHTYSNDSIFICVPLKKRQTFKHTAGITFNVFGIKY